MRISVLLACYCLIAGFAVNAQNCPYETIAGQSRTFYGDNVKATEAQLYRPSWPLAAPDGSIYFSDEYNNRVRRIDAGGIIHTVAGTGEAAFKGDGGQATQAALNRPGKLALASDGSLFITDAGNQRIRKVSSAGIITTVAGSGYKGLAGDGGPAIQAALNGPSDIALDPKGNLFILDYGNQRVRRVGTDGIIITFAGSWKPGNSNYYGDTVADAQPAAKAKLDAPSAIAVDKNSVLYIAESQWIRQVDTNGTMTPFTNISGSRPKPGTPVALTQFVCQGAASLSFRKDGSMLIESALVYVVENGLVKAVNSVPERGRLFAADITSTTLLMSSGNVIYRRHSAEDLTLLAGISEESQVFKSVAVAPDGTVYVADYTEGVFRVGAGGSLTRVIDTSGVISMAVDSQGNLLFVSSFNEQLLRMDKTGAIKGLFTCLNGCLGVRVDAQDHIYVMEGGLGYQFVGRLEANHSITALIGDPYREIGYFGSSLQGDYGGFAVAPDGTVFAGTSSYGRNSLRIAKRTPSAGDTQPSYLKGDIRFVPAAIAVASSGVVYAAGADGVIYRVDSDGTVIPIRNMDGNGFTGEHGYDSGVAWRAGVSDMVIDPQGRLLVAEPYGYGVRRFDPAQCSADVRPVVGGIVDGGVFSSGYAIPGSVVSLFGSRLGPATGVGMKVKDGKVTTELEGTRVLVNGTPAPMLYTSAGQINAVVPFAAATAESTYVVEYNGVASLPRTQPGFYYAPAIFNRGSDYHIAAAINQDGSINDYDHRAPVGSIVSIWVTGLGQTTPDSTDGLITTNVLKHPVAPVSIWVAGKPATVNYAGSAPGMVEGVMQVNFTVPPLGNPDGAPYCLTIGQGEYDGTGSCTVHIYAKR